VQHIYKISKTLAKQHLKIQTLKVKHYNLLRAQGSQTQYQYNQHITNRNIDNTKLSVKVYTHI